MVLLIPTPRFYVRGGSEELGKHGRWVLLWLRGLTAEDLEAGEEGVSLQTLLIVRLLVLGMRKNTLAVA